MDVENRAGLCVVAYATVARAAATHETLSDIVAWGLSRTPQRMILAVVIQDEYTHDVVIAFDDRLHLVYDTT
jgi:hypothetical protein